MKTRRPNPGILFILLFVVSFFAALSLPVMPGPVAEPYTFQSDLWGSIVSLIVLLGLCLISARVILWAYARIRPPQHPARIYSYGFLISATGVFIDMGLSYFQGRYVWNRIKDQLHDIAYPGYINFLRAGFGPLVLTCAIVTIVLLWIARWKKTKEESGALLSTANRKQDLILILSTLVTYAFSIKSMWDFIRFSLSIWGVHWDY
jgi:hypothetical protein